MKKFVYKSAEEVEKMTPEEQTAYLKEKTAHETAMTAKIEKQEEDLETLKTKLDEAEEKDAATIKELVDKAEENLKALVQQSLSNAPAKGTLKGFIGKVAEVFKDHGYKGLNLGDEEEKGYKEAEFKVLKGGRPGVVIKAFDSLDTLTVNDVDAATYPTNGSTSLGEGFKSLFAYFVGYFEKPRPVSMIMDHVTLEDLRGVQVKMWNDNVVADFKVLKECELKPYARYSGSVQTEDISHVAILWRTTTFLRKWFPAIANRIRQKIARLLDENLPKEVLKKITEVAVPYTPVPNLTPIANANKYDCIAASIASYKRLNGVMPKLIRFNEVTWFDLVTNKDTTGNYNHQNGNSIAMVTTENGSSYLNFAGFKIQYELDESLTYDTFQLGDFSELRVGINGELDYYDALGNTPEANAGIDRNIWTSELVMYFIAYLPENRALTIVEDTFTNVKASLTL
ncbi:hypothetical protein CLU97_3350 [Chryseobacterium sp. 7]|uniref:hypothetical protein n=1 Tax=Chryseobacterium sp. 7 TaxID=2035214 RepID=UPI000EB2D936|nr:hypothetical protein [Chryseobacterium sp. 7]RLJ33861.1 hypothetical protein CLU97_3350 [Chryseobacterium sp. 7]